MFSAVASLPRKNSVTLEYILGVWVKKCHPGHTLLKWFNLGPTMDKYMYALFSVIWN